MPTKYAHTNIIAKDWKALAKFYSEVFDCTFVPPERNQSGEWLSQATGVENARLQGVHLRLPGFGEGGPTLEIYSYEAMLEKLTPAANRMGFGHLAFSVDDVEACLAKVIAKGGSSLGQVKTQTVKGAGTITVVYAADPEGNILELQTWA